MVPRDGNDGMSDEEVDRFDTGQSPPTAGDRNIRYRLSTKIAMSSDDFQVLNDAGEHVFRVSGRALASHDTIRIENQQGTDVRSALVRTPRKQERVDILDGSGSRVGSVVRHQISPLRDQFTLELPDGRQLAVDGNVSTHEFVIVGPSGQVAEVSRRWFRAQSSYGVEIVKDQDDALLLTTVVVLDQLIHGLP